MKISVKGQQILDEFMDVLVLLEITSWHQINPTRFYIFNNTYPSTYPTEDIGEK